jgi:hypothetical protein
MLPQVVKSLEEQIQVLTYAQEQKDGMLYRLREAIAKRRMESRRQSPRSAPRF